jgi:phosphatidylserine decarboxylase
MGRLFVSLQYLLPHHLLCRMIYALTRVRVVWLKNLFIGLFVRSYRPEMGDAVEPSPTRYETFNAFFTRALKAGARPLDPDPARIVSPCDGTLSVAATLEADRLIQAKGRDYAFDALVAANGPHVERLRGGAYATIYLAPYNYHRLHMPIDGALRSAWYVPGRLFSVNARTVERVPNLFARNERLVLMFDGATGPFCLVLVGALFVGSMSTVWHGEVTPWRGGALPAGPGRPMPLQPRGTQDLFLARGQEFARFNMGSTIVMLLPPDTVDWDRAMQPNLRLRVGQGMGLQPAGSSK